MSASENMAPSEGHQFEKTDEETTTLQRAILKITRLSRHRLEKKYKMLLVILAAALLTAPSTMKHVSMERCLHSCDCTGTEDQVAVQCHGLPPGSWPAILPRNTTSLILSHNPLQSFTSNSLHNKGLDHLDTLELSNSRITTVDTDAFRGLHHLKFLDMSYNNAKNLTTAHFKYLESLVAIRLMGNDYEECVKIRRDLFWVKVLCGPHDSRRPSSTQDTSPSPGAEMIVPTKFKSTTIVESSTSSPVTWPATTTSKSVVHQEEGGHATVADVVVYCFACVVLVAAAFFVAYKMGLKEKLVEFMR